MPIRVMLSFACTANGRLSIARNVPLRSVTVTTISSLRLLDRQESPETSQVGSKRRPNGRQAHQIGFQDQLG